MSDPASAKLALSFLGRSAVAFAQAPDAPGAQPKPNTPVVPVQVNVVPGYQSFIYERLVPLAFTIPASPSFNIKDGQVLTVSVYSISTCESCSKVSIGYNGNWSTPPTYLSSAWARSYRLPCESISSFQKLATDPYHRVRRQASGVGRKAIQKVLRRVCS